MQLREKIAELDEPKVVPYLSMQLRRGQIEGVLSLFPEITEQFPALAEPLTRLHQSALKKEKLLKQTQPTSMDVSQAQCPGCGAALHRARPDAKAVVCNYCGVRFEPDNPDGTKRKVVDPDHYHPHSFVRLGMTCNFDGVTHQVVGRTNYVGRCREWDSEDSTWESSPWRFEEWMLLGEDRSFRYLGHDEEGLYLSKEFAPTAPSMPGANDRKMTLMKDRSATNIDEHGMYQLRYFEGEFGWVPEVNESLRTAEYKMGKAVLSAEERTLADSRQPVEIEFFQTRDVKVKELLVAFDRKPELKEFERREKVVGQFRLFRRIALVIAVALVVLGILRGTDGETVIREQVNISDIGPDGYLVGPFDLGKDGAVHSIQLGASFPNNSWTFIGAELLDANQDAINAVDGDFWHESGYDDGYWSETNNKSDRFFRLTEPGRYFIRLSHEQGTAQGSGSVNVAVTQGAVLMRYYLLPALLALLVFIGLIRVMPKMDLVRGLRKEKTS